MSANPKLINVSTSADVADALGAARAALKEAQDEVKFLETLAKASHEEVLEGRLFRVTVSRGIETRRVDWKAVAEFLQPSRQLVTAHTKVSVSDRVTCTAHKKD
jgi:hypothetical protein